MRTALIAFVASLMPLTTRAQTPPVSASASAFYESYSFGNAEAVGVRSIALLSAPFTFSAGGRLVTFDVTGGWARATLQQADGTRVTLSGPTDTHASLRLAVPGRHASLAVVAALPTGETAYSAEEARIIGALASDLLPFRISTWGTGGQFGLVGAVQRDFGTIGLGLSAAWVGAREMDLLEDAAFAYRPGNEVRLRAAADLDAGVAGKLSLQVTWQHSATDLLDGQNLYEAGDRWQVMASYAFAAGRTASGIVYGGALLRESGRHLLEPALVAPRHELLLAGAGLRVPVGGFTLQPTLDARLLRSAEEAGAGAILGVGLAAERRNAGGLAVTPVIRARFGALDGAAGASSGLVAFDAGLSIGMGRSR